MEAAVDRVWPANGRKTARNWENPVGNGDVTSGDLDNGEGRG